MRRLFVLGAAAILAVPAPVFAQDAPLPAADADAEIGAIAETLRDPAMQAQASATLGALSQVLLNLKVAPFVEAIEQATGAPVYDIDRDDRVRDLAPEAEHLPDMIDRELPRAMDRMAGMGDAMQTLLPALRDIAAQFERAIEDSTNSVR